MAVLEIKGIIGEDFTALDFKAWLKANPDNEYTFIINSVGGDIDNGFGIAREIEMLQNTTTIAEKVCSIATVIYLAGEKRIADEGSRFLVHLPFVPGKDMPDYNFTSYDFSEYAKHLKKKEVEIANYYSKRTNFSVEEALEAMKSDNSFGAETAAALGFSNTSRKLKAVAMFNEFFKKYAKASGAADGEKTPETPETPEPQNAEVTREEFDSLAQKIAELSEAVQKITEMLTAAETQMAEALPNAIAMATEKTVKKALADMKISAMSTNGGEKIPQKSVNFDAEKTVKKTAFEILKERRNG